MKKCTICETLFPPSYNKCPKCGSSSVTSGLKFSNKHVVVNISEDVKETVSPMVDHSVSNLWIPSA